MVVLLVPLPGLGALREGVLGGLLPSFGESRSVKGREVLRYIDPLIGTTNGGERSFELGRWYCC